MDMKTIRRWMVLFLCLTLLTPCLALSEGEDEEDEDAEESVYVSEEIMKEIEELDAIDDDEIVYVVGETYHEPDASEFNASSPALFTCKTLDGKMGILYSDRSIESPKVVASNDRLNLDLLSVGLVWCVARSGNSIGYVKRDKLTAFSAVDPENTAPYGTMKSTYVARTKGYAHVRKSMSDQDADWVVLNPDSRISIWRIQDGWAIVIYMRSYGYISMNELTELIPVSPTDTPIRDDSPIGAYTSFYKMTDNEANIGRIHNIANAASRLSRVLQSGEEINIDFSGLSIHEKREGSRVYQVDNYDRNETGKYHGDKKHIYSVNRDVINSDVIINFCKPKSHRLAGFTAAMKNMKR